MSSVFRRKSGQWCGKWKDSTGKYRYVYRSTEDAVREALQLAVLDAPITSNNTVAGSTPRNRG
jgi:hypothetical protein